jgi:hypothetical protein
MKLTIGRLRSMNNPAESVLFLRNLCIERCPATRRRLTPERCNFFHRPIRLPYAHLGHQGNPDRRSCASQRFSLCTELQLSILSGPDRAFLDRSLRVNTVQQSLLLHTDLTG